MITEEATKAKWRVFLSDWSRYKASQKVKAIGDIRNEVLNCCHEDVRLSLEIVRGKAWSKLTEEELLARIKKAAVRTAHVSIHRNFFHKMKQEDNENFNHWVTRLHQQMQLCDYRLPCNTPDCEHDHNYGDILLEEAMIANMYDQDAMARIMNDHKVTNTYEKKFEMAMSLQESHEAMQEIFGSTSTSNRRSDYKVQQGAVPKKPAMNSKGNCSVCKKTFRTCPHFSPN